MHEKRYSRVSKEQGGDILDESGETGERWAIGSQGFRGNNGTEAGRVREPVIYQAEHSDLMVK